MLSPAWFYHFQEARRAKFCVFSLIVALGKAAEISVRDNAKQMQICLKIRE